MIYDHLLQFSDEATARASLSEYWITPSDDLPSGAWRGDVCIPGVSVSTEAGGPFPGWFIVIALPAVSATLRDMPDHACRLVADRDAANAGQPFLRFVAADMDPGALASAKMVPTFAGSTYPFGA